MIPAGPPPINPQIYAHLRKLEAEHRASAAGAASAAPDNAGRSDDDLALCPHCLGIHIRYCPRVKSFHLSYHSNGTPHEYTVEYFRDDEWDNTGIVWPAEHEEET